MNNISAFRDQMNSTIGKDAKTVITKEFEIRNLVIGMAGIVANILAFFGVFKTSRIPKPRKLLLLNLVISDIMSAATLFVYGFENSHTRTSDQKGCVPLIFCLVCSILYSTVICFILSVINVLAVYKPFEFKNLVSWKHTGFGSTLTLLVVGALTYWWSAQLPPGRTCAPVVVFTEVALIGSGAIMLIGSVGVFTINTVTFIRLKKTFCVSSHQFARALHQNRRQLQRSQAKVSDLFVASQQNSFPESKQVDVVIGTEHSIIKSVPNPDDLNVNNRQDASLSQISSFDVNSPKLCESLIQPLSTNHPEATNNHALEVPISSKRISTGNSKALKVLCEEDVTKSRTVKSFQRKERVCKTLIILTTYSCILLLPVAVYLILIVANIIEDPEAIVSTSAGIFVSSCPMIKAGINPFFYVQNSPIGKTAFLKEMATALLVVKIEHPTLNKSKYP